jgi:hypothetical protein
MTQAKPAGFQMLNKRPRSDAGIAAGRESARPGSTAVGCGRVRPSKAIWSWVPRLCAEGVGRGSIVKELHRDLSKPAKTGRAMSSL